jgi:hypothetical protein
MKRRLAILVLAVAGLVAMSASSASAHEGGYYWSKQMADDYWQVTAMRPFGAYDGITIHYANVACKGYQYQWPSEFSPPTLHRSDGTYYKHLICLGTDRVGRWWSWWAHGHEAKMSFTSLKCDRGGRLRCASAFGP